MICSTYCVSLLRSEWHGLKNVTAVKIPVDTEVYLLLFSH